jgi:hypothetical protein
MQIFHCIVPKNLLKPDAKCNISYNAIFSVVIDDSDRLCGLVVEFLTADAGVPGSIPGHYKKK